MRLGRRRIRAVAAGQIRPGDVLWSSATNRELLVIACARVLVDPAGNLLDDTAELESDTGTAPAETNGSKPKMPAIVLSVRTPDGALDRLGAFAPQTRVQVLR